MATFRIPVEAHVWTARGPWRAADVPAGEQLVVVARDGRPAISRIDSISAPDERQVVRLLTSAGEIHLDARSSVTTRGARVYASALAATPLGGRSSRIELAHPNHLPHVAVRKALPAAARSALALLDPPVVRVPRRLGVGERLAELLQAAGVEYVDASDDRWTAMAFDRGFAAPPTGPADRADVGVLEAITAWARQAPGRTVCRTTLEQARLRQRLVAALAASGRPASVAWVPAYGPVEARISAGAGGPFADVHAVAVTDMQCVDLSIEADGSAITDLAVVSARPSAHAA